MGITIKPKKQSTQKRIQNFLLSSLGEHKPEILKKSSTHTNNKSVLTPKSDTSTPSSLSSEISALKSSLASNDNSETPKSEISEKSPRSSISKNSEVSEKSDEHSSRKHTDHVTEDADTDHVTKKSHRTHHHLHFHRHHHSHDNSTKDSRSETKENHTDSEKSDLKESLSRANEQDSKKDHQDEEKKTGNTHARESALSQPQPHDSKARVDGVSKVEIKTPQQHHDRKDREKLRNSMRLMIRSSSFHQLKIRKYIEYVLSLSFLFLSSSLFFFPLFLFSFLTLQVLLNSN